MMAGIRFLSLWRLSNFGTRVFAIQETLMSAAVNQMLAITTLLLGLFIVALMVLARQADLSVAVYTYRGFMFGDGDGFSGIGMEDMNNVFLLLFSIVGAFAFNVLVLNIIIAIYGNEYDRAEKDTSWLFLLGRAKYCVTTILSSYMIPWSGREANESYVMAAFLMMFMGLFVGVIRTGVIHYLWVGAVLLAAGQILLGMAMIQCDWFSPEGGAGGVAAAGPEGDASEEKPMFLWICHDRNWQSFWTQNAMSPGEAQDEDEATEKIAALEEKVESMDHKLDQILSMLKRPASPVRHEGFRTVPETPSQTAFNRTETMPG
jgi:hypothetical protein